MYIWGFIPSIPKGIFQFPTLKLLEARLVKLLKFPMTGWTLGDKTTDLDVGIFLLGYPMGLFF